MQTQRDHVHAYQFMVDRMTSALVLGDPAAPDPPARRVSLALIFGIVLAVLTSVGFGVYGVIKPGGNNAWRRPGVILVEKETGTRYVMRDGVLYPMFNHASALLAQGGGARVESISRESLTGLPHGPQTGIQGAPDPVPDAAKLVAGPVTTCPAPARAGQLAGVVVFAGLRWPERDMPEDRYVLVRDPAGTRYLVWRGLVHKLSDPAVPVALGMAVSTEFSVTPGWLATARAGGPFGRADIPGAGTPGPAVGGQKHPVGRLFRYGTADGERFAVLLADGLAPVDATEFALLAGRAGTAPPVQSNATEVAAAPASADRSMVGRLPDLLRLRPLDQDGWTPCARHTTDGTRVQASMVLVQNVPLVGVADAAVVLLPPGSGLLAAGFPAPPNRRPEQFLITDQGVRHLIADDESVTALGYGGRPPFLVPAQVLDVIRTGPTLSRAALGASTRG
ncbi:MAG: type VII secretion protein EccB [Kibdelosporangium sp.]